MSSGGGNDSPAPLRLGSSLLDRAVANDEQALTAIFRQFIPMSESLRFAEYLGSYGLWGFGVKSFACLTERRVATLRVGSFGYVVYQDGFLEHTNSGVILQPSLLSLYLSIAVVTLAILLGSLSLLVVSTGVLLLGIVVVTALLLLFSWSAVIRLYYRMNKCGFVWWVREGVSVYAFANRGRIQRANHLYRLCVDARDVRLRAVGRMGAGG